MIKKYKFLFLSFLIILIGLIIPSPYVIEVPGPSFNTLSNSIISIKGNNKNISGQLRFVTVSMYGTERDLPLYFAIFNYFNKNSRVLPADAVLDKNLSSNEQDKVFVTQMDDAQKNALIVAKNKLKLKKLPTITLSSSDAGGPSAGLMYTLGLISKLTGKSLTGNNIVAGTGTIDKNGVVGEIGGVRQKIIGASNDGAKFFLMPTNNCKEAKGYIPKKTVAYNVKNLNDALYVLKFIKSGKTNELSNHRCI